MEFDSKAVQPIAQFQMPVEGRMIFNVGGKEWMVVEASGDIYVRGTKVDSDRKVYECVREWLNVAMPGRL